MKVKAGKTKHRGQAQQCTFAGVTVFRSRTLERPMSPRYQYDCSRCKFSWCCGPACSCGLRRTHPDPPVERQRQVDATLVQIGYAPQFRGEGAQRR